MHSHCLSGRVVIVSTLLRGRLGLISDMGVRLRVTLKWYLNEFKENLISFIIF